MYKSKGKYLSWINTGGGEIWINSTITSRIPNNKIIKAIWKKRIKICPTVADSRHRWPWGSVNEQRNPGFYDWEVEDSTKSKKLMKNKEVPRDPLSLKLLSSTQFPHSPTMSTLTSPQDLASSYQNIGNLSLPENHETPLPSFTPGSLNHLWPSSISCLLLMKSLSHTTEAHTNHVTPNVSASLLGGSWEYIPSYLRSEREVSEIPCWNSKCL